MAETQTSVNVPVEVGGRAVTSFNTGGVAVQVEGTQAEADAQLKKLQAEQLQMQISAIRQGIVMTRHFTLGPRQ